jgi:hypothetical protein
MTDLVRPPATSRRHSRWWLAAATAIGVITIGAWLWAEWERSVGKAHFQRVISEIKAAGRPGTIADYLALLPKVDAQLQQDWMTLQQRRAYGELDEHREQFDYPKIDEQGWSKWVGGERPDPPTGASAELAKSQVVMSELLALVRRGPLILGVNGWAAQDFAPGRDNGFASACLHAGNLLILRDMGEWLRHHALLADSADGDLADLDRLIAAIAHPGCAIDAMIALPLNGMRDRCYVELAVQKRLPVERKARWLSETPHAYELMADGLRGDRIVFIGSVAGSLDRSLFRFWEESRKWPGQGLSLRQWVFGMEEETRKAELEDQVELLVREGTPLPVSIRDAVREGNPIDISWLNHAPVMAMKAEASHRIARLGIRIIGMARAGGLPSTQADLGQRLGDPRILDHDGRHLGLTYQLLAKDRFRLSADPESAPPDLADPSSEPWKTAVNDLRNAIHAPASKQSFVYYGNLTFEARVHSE